MRFLQYDRRRRPCSARSSALWLPSIWASVVSGRVWLPQTVFRSSRGKQAKQVTSPGLFLCLSMLGLCSSAPAWPPHRRALGPRSTGGRPAARGPKARPQTGRRGPKGGERKGRGEGSKNPPPPHPTPPPGLKNERATAQTRTQRPVYLDLLPPATMPARPAKTSRRGSRTPPPAASARRGKRSSRTIRCRRFTVASAITPARANCNREPLDGPFRSTRSSASSAIRALAEGWTPTDHRPADRQAHPGRRRRSERLVRAHHLALMGHTVEIHEAGPDRRRHDALRHPLLPAAARHPRRRDQPHRAFGREDRLQSQGRGPRRREGEGQVRCGVRRRRRAPVQEDRHPRPRRRQDPGCGELSQGRGDGQGAPSSAAGSPSMAAATPPWMLHGSPCASATSR